MSNIVLSAGVRQNLLSLQKTADLMATTQNRLATGKKVNSALDNPTNFFTSAALQSRAGDLNALLDSMGVGIKTLEAADNGVTAITKTIEAMQSTLRQARQDKSFKSVSYQMNLPVPPAGTEQLSLSGGAIGTPAINISLTATSAPISTVPATRAASGGMDFTADTNFSALNNQKITLDDGNGNTSTYTFSNAAGGQYTAATAALGTAGFTATATATGISFSRADGRNFTITATNGAAATAIGHPGAQAAGGVTTTDGVIGAPATTSAKTVDALVAEINSNINLKDKIRASNDAGKLRIDNLSTTELTIGGVDSTTGAIIGSGAGTSEIGGNQVRANLVKQFNELRDQLDKLADDASFSGINLLRGDKLKITFNETGTSTLEIQAKDLEGKPTTVNGANLGIFLLHPPDVDSDDNIDVLLNDMTNALGKLRTHASNFGSNLSIVQNRTEFTKAMKNTLETGADNLVLADSNEEAANLLALQTRQQLSSTALSLASQADQAVLRLFG